MYAVIKSGGKQHRVEEGEFLRVEKLDIATGEKIDFDEVLMITNGDDVKIGTPFLAGVKVTAEILTHGRADKVKIIKFNRRKHSRKQMGHRQWFTEIKIISIGSDIPKAEAKPKTVAKPKTAAKPKTTAKPKTAAKPKTVAKPKIVAKSKTVAKPKTVAKSKIKTEDKK